jgi:DNA-directed RNA polymerase subunit RPC12/RpoP
MELKLKCAGCGGIYDLDSKTRRRIIYKCTTCGKELPVRKKSPKQSEEVEETKSNN